MMCAYFKRDKNVMVMAKGYISPCFVFPTICKVIIYVFFFKVPSVVLKLLLTAIKIIVNSFSSSSQEKYITNFFPSLVYIKGILKL